jgi:hypothetical protein
MGKKRGGNIEGRREKTPIRSQGLGKQSISSGGKLRNMSSMLFFSLAIVRF